jgi:hypothetical protein
MYNKVILESFISKELEALHQTLEYDLKPVKRLALYDAFENQKTIDFLAVLTAKHVVPIWQEALLNSSCQEIISSEKRKKQHVLEEILPGQELNWLQSLENISFLDLPIYLLSIAEKILWGTIPRDIGGKIAGEAHYIIGNISEMCDLPPEADDAGMAALNALIQAERGLDFLKFVKYVKQNPAITDSQIYSGDSDAVSAAVKASANVYKELEQADIDLQKRRNFWEWWLTEAIPQAWELAEKS